MNFPTINESLSFVSTFCYLIFHYVNYSLNEHSFYDVEALLPYNFARAPWDENLLVQA